LRISAAKYPKMAENIHHAQKAGHPRVLTHGGNARANRNDACKQSPTIDGYHRDEYPFAASKEGGPSAWVGHVPIDEHRYQGAMIKDFIEKNKIKPGNQYRVIITP
jgi:Deoxyribonuclease NucA/NucB